MKRGFTRIDVKIIHNSIQVDKREITYMFTALTPTGRAVPSYLHETSPETRSSVDDNGQTDNATKLKLSNLYIRIFTQLSDLNEPLRSLRPSDAGVTNGRRRSLATFNTLEERR